MRKIGIRKHGGAVIGQRRGKSASGVIDDQDLAFEFCRFTSSCQVSKEEFVRRIPRTKRLIRTSRIAYEFKFALGHSQPFIASKHVGIVSKLPRKQLCNFAQLMSGQMVILATHE